MAMKKLLCLLLAAAMLCTAPGKGTYADELFPEETVQVTEEPTQIPDFTPVPENTPEVTQQPAPEVPQEPSQEPDVQPEETPEPVETFSPEPDNGAEASQAPVMTDTPVPEPEATPDPSETIHPGPVVSPRPELDQAWVWQADGENRIMQTGKLFDFVEALEQETEIFLSTVEVLCLENVHVQKFLLARLMLDEEYFQGEGWLICVSEGDPTQGEIVYEFDPEQWTEAQPEDVITLYVWVTYIPEETSTPEPTQSEAPVPEQSNTPVPEVSESPAPEQSVTPLPEGDEPIQPEQSGTPLPEDGESPVPEGSEIPEGTPEPSETPDPDAVILQVEAENFVAGDWGSQVPVFRLSGIPEGKDGYSYAAIIFDKQFVVLSEDCYTAAEEGIYTVRLVILDEMYDIVSASDNYTLWLDYTLPDLMITMDQQMDYTVHISAGDQQSGLAGITLDGGETWLEMPEEGVYTITAQEQTTYPAGMIQARDHAGNISVCEEDVTLIKIPSWGGGGGGGGGSQPVPHAPATQVSSSPYNAVGLELPEETMHTLVMDGEEMELTLDLLWAQDADIPQDYQAAFRLSLDSWTQRVVDEEGVEQLVRDEENPDVLVLEAAYDEVFVESCELYALTWQVNGAVIRKLFNSGINYLVLKSGEDLLVLPTQGFTAGTRYAELKMAGVSTKKFDYTITMQVDLREKPEQEMQPEEEQLPWQFSDTCDVQMSVAVEEEVWEMPLAEAGEMYAEKVYCGPYAMLEVPYGEYQISEEAIGQ